MDSIGFIGCGNMAGAIVGSLLSGNFCKAESIHVVDTTAAKCVPFAEKGVVIEKSIAELAKNCKYLFLCVKPQNFSDVLSELNGHVNENHVLVSIAAGISSAYIKKGVGFDVKTVLVMPNTPLLLGKGASALCRVEPTAAEEFEVVLSVFRSAGVVEELAEDKMKEVIAINGSSPAFVYLFAKAVADYAEDAGINPQKAINLFSQTLIGSAAMMTQSGDDLPTLIKKVSSPGGTTLAALESFYNDGFEDTIIKAMRACTKRAYELGK